MKKLLLILLLFSAVNCFAQKLDFKGLYHYTDLLFSQKSGSKDEALSYLEKNCKMLSGELTTVCEEDENLPFQMCSIILKKDTSSEKYEALYLTKHEVVFEGKEIEQKTCFLAGTATLPAEGDKTKTIPVYITLDALLNVIETFSKEK